MLKKFMLFIATVGTVLVGLLTARIDMFPFNIILMGVFAFVLIIYANISEDKMSVSQRILRNVVAGILIVIGGIGILQDNHIKGSHSFPQGTELSELQISFDEMVLQYADSAAVHFMTKDIDDELKPESVKFESHDYDVLVTDYHMEDKKIIFEGVPAGNCLIEIKFENYDLISENIKLNKKDQDDGKWERNFTLQRETDYKNFGIYLLDQEGEPLSGSTCKICIQGAENSIEGVVASENGLLPYKFMCANDQILQVVLYEENGAYEENIYVESVSGDVRLTFSDVFSNATLEKLEYQKKQKEQKEQAAALKQQEMKANPRLLLEHADRPKTSITENESVIFEYKDELTEEEREKNWKFTLKNDGPIWVEFAHENLTYDSIAWEIEIVDNMEENYLTFYSDMNKVNTISQFAGLEKGKYSVIVRSYNNFSDAEFDLKIKSVSMDNFEKEKNDEIISANVITQILDNEMITIHGNIDNFYDRDYYQIDVEQDGVIGMSFCHDNYTDNFQGWKISLINFDSEVLAEFTSNWQTTKTYAPNIGIAAGTYYVLVEQNDNFNDGLYELNMVWHASDYWEKEFNDEISSARNYLVEGFGCCGSIMSMDDNDYYIFQCERTGTYKVTFEHENLTDEYRSWVISVLNRDSEELWEDPLYSCVNQVKVERDVPLKEGEVYYILVDRYDYLQNSDYTITLAGK